MTQKLNKIETKKAASFLDNEDQSSIFLKNIIEAFIKRQIVRDLKLTVAIVRVYSGVNYAEYQSSIPAYEHVCCMHLIVYQKNLNKVLYGIKDFEKTFFATWFYYKKKFRRINIS